MPADEPAAIAARIRSEVEDVTRHLNRLTGELDALVNSLSDDPALSARPHQGAPTAAAPVMRQPGLHPAGGQPPQPFVAGRRPAGHSAPPRPPGQLGAPQQPYPPAGQPGRPPFPPPHPQAHPGIRQPGPAGPQQPMRKPRRPVSVAEIFSIVGSAVTLVGVALVLLLPQDGFLGPIPRTVIALVLAGAAIGMSFWQHRNDPKNLGTQALFATGLASVFLCLAALTMIFEGPDGQYLLALVPGMVLAGVVSLAALWVARLWKSQWLAVLAVLGSLVIAPFLDAESLVVLSFMVIMTVLTGVLQRGLGWTWLIAARVLPTMLHFLVLVMGTEPPPESLSQHQIVVLVLAVVFAIAGLGLALLHQGGTEPERVGSVLSTVAMAMPLLVVGMMSGELIPQLALVVTGALFTAVGFVPKLAVRIVQATAIATGAALIAGGVLVIFDGDHQASLLFILAFAYLAVALAASHRVVLIVGSVLAALSVVYWLPSLFGVFSLVSTVATPEAAASSLLGLIVAIVAALAYTKWFPRRQGVIGNTAWVAAPIFGSAAIVYAGTWLGDLLDAAEVGFQVSHAVVSVTWMLLCVVQLQRGLRSRKQVSSSIGLAIGFAVASVSKLFLFDLGTLPGLARALAFIAVGVLLLAVGTWYYGELGRARVRKQAAPSSPTAPPPPPHPAAAAPPPPPPAAPPHTQGADH